MSIVLENGSVYKFPGKLLFTGITVDPSTGNVNLRAEVPNPDQVLLPGMYVRVRLDEGWTRRPCWCRSKPCSAPPTACRA